MNKESLARQLLSQVVRRHQQKFECFKANFLFLHKQEMRIQTWMVD